jgi:hypothetical protein
MSRAQRTRSKPQWKHRIIAAVLLGALTTVLSAWFFVLSTPLTNSTVTMCALNSPSDQDLYIRTLHEKARGIHWFFIRPQDLNHYPVNEFSPDREPAWRITTETLTDADRALRFYFRGGMYLPEWLPQTIDPDPGLIGYSGRAAGWPMLAMRSIATCEHPNQGLVLSWTVRFRPPAPPNIARSPQLDPFNGTLPLRPIPLGFAANTALFSVAWWVLLLGHRDIRRVIRRRRNLCEHCAYPRESLAPETPCPECGSMPS